MNLSLNDKKKLKRKKITLLSLILVSALLILTRFLPLDFLNPYRQSAGVLALCFVAILIAVAANKYGYSRLKNKEIKRLRTGKINEQMIRALTGVTAIVLIIVVLIWKGDELRFPTEIAETETEIPLPDRDSTVTTVPAISPPVSEIEKKEAASYRDTYTDLEKEQIKSNDSLETEIAQLRGEEKSTSGIMDSLIYRRDSLLRIRDELAQNKKHPCLPKQEDKKAIVTTPRITPKKFAGTRSMVKRASKSKWYSDSQGQEMPVTSVQSAIDPLKEGPGWSQ